MKRRAIREAAKAVLLRNGFDAAFAERIAVEISTEPIPRAPGSDTLSHWSRAADTDPRTKFDRLNEALGKLGSTVDESGPAEIPSSDVPSQGQLAQLSSLHAHRREVD